MMRRLMKKVEKGFAGCLNYGVGGAQLRAEPPARRWRIRFRYYKLPELPDCITYDKK